ncbi:MAG TPA: L-seryl-tRNA(Sec) selenium transferase [Vicinamibacteria bacterium]|nr:L-seryl-tRNA(Sec) selenium transferase [Vicinamibacteria bacterium]
MELRRIPSVEKLLARDGFTALIDLYGRTGVVAATREVLEALRRDLALGMTEEQLEAALDDIEAAIDERLERSVRPSLGRALNATGVLIHTNLGRAPLSPAARRAIAEVAMSYSNLELNLENGSRGSRHQHAAHLLSRLFPGTKALVVNNAAAAVMLSLNTFSLGKEVVISRGELVEIGGSFRIPEILERSGARLREVGTTNKTRLSDYEKAIGSKTGAILRVHPSNFRIVGFTESAPTPELVRIGREHGLPVIEDFGSGNLLRLGAYGLPDEPTVSDSLASGVDLSIFSGDKLLGGPQAGILVGKPDRIDACRSNPMARALRVDKLVYAALEATLASHLREHAVEEIPVLQMLALPAEVVRKRASALVERLADASSLSLTVHESVSRVGGGAAADAEIPTYVVSLEMPGTSSDAILEALRRHAPPIIARISEDRVLFDLRTLLPVEDAILEEALRGLEQSRGGSGSQADR